MSSQNSHVEYDYTVAKLFLFSCIVLGIVGMLVGVSIAFELAYPELNNILGEYSTFGRLRPLHTNAIIFGFTLSGIFASWYYMGQRLLKISLAEHPFINKIGKIHFGLYILVIVSAVVSLLMGFTTSKEYAELEWPIDLLVVIVWLSWGLSIFSMISVRREKSLYVSIWYFIATFLAVAMLYLFNNASVPTYFVSGVGSWLHSVSMYAGTNDAMVQWWYGHNAVGFVFTVPIVGMIYYFLPKESAQPIYSYKLSLLAFWGLIFVYVWAGGHHVLYSTAPDWMQTLGSVMSVILILPSWGSAINMFLTMKGQWQQLQDNVLLKFMLLASTFYMLSTIEGPLQAIKSVNAIAHFTDWIVGHVHDGTLGWVGFMIIAAIFHMTPRIFKKEIYSKSLIETQFWIQTIGIVLYFSSMWISGITQGMMWRATDEYGNLLYSFIDTVSILHPYYLIRGVGGLLYLVGTILWAYNIYKTIRCGKELQEEPISATPCTSRGE
ncbi:Cytochrome c oxidase subunit CcoN [hydrothermal vent metagenome]|uniref:Cytochrome c oxidase subunit CcoN n=1 Tax=hydrothermal vent metagenome TaxID=652676 RepID=A0A3B1E7S1_9ZZZZ